MKTTLIVLLLYFCGSAEITAQTPEANKIVFLPSFDSTGISKIENPWVIEYQRYTHAPNQYINAEPLPIQAARREIKDLLYNHPNKLCANALNLQPAYVAKVETGRKKSGKQLIRIQEEGTFFVAFDTTERAWHAWYESGRYTTLNSPSCTFQRTVGRRQPQPIK